MTHDLAPAPLLTQEQINAAVAPDTLRLYYALQEAGFLPEDGHKTDAYAAAIDALQDRTRPDPALHALARTLDDVAFDFAMTCFEDGFRRGVAFTRWLAGRPELTA